MHCQLEAAQAEVDIQIDTTEEDQVGEWLAPEDAGDTTKEDEKEFPRVVAVMEAPQEYPLRQMESENAQASLVGLLLCPLEVPAGLEVRHVEGLPNLVKRMS